MMKTQEDNKQTLQSGQFVSLQFACLFAKLPQPGDSKVTFLVFESSYSTTSTCYYQYNHSKVEANLLSALH